MLSSEVTKTTIDHATFTITFHRALAAPRETVFEAWTVPEHITQWWDPTGRPLARASIELSVGGQFEFVNDGHSPPFAGVYKVIDRPSKLVFEALGSVGTVRLEADGSKTRMTVTIRCMSAEHLEQFVKLGVDVNTEKTLDNLLAYVAKRQAS